MDSKYNTLSVSVSTQTDTSKANVDRTTDTTYLDL